MRHDISLDIRFKRIQFNLNQKTVPAPMYEVVGILKTIENYYLHGGMHDNFSALELATIIEWIGLEEHLTNALVQGEVLKIEEDDLFSVNPWFVEQI